MSCGCGNELKQPIKLINIIQHSEEIYSYDFEKIFDFEWSPGAHSKLFLNIDGRLEGKKFSYASLTSEKIIRFTTRIKKNPSPYKRAFSQLKINDVVEVTVPKENFELMRDNHPIVLLSNGVGIAAVRSFIKAFEDSTEGIAEMIQINIDRKSETYKNEFDALMKKNKNFKSFFYKDRDAFYAYLDYEVQDLMKRHKNSPYFYVVGSTGFVIDMIQYLKSVGFTDDEILLDGQSIFGGCGCSSGCGCGADMEGILVAEA